MMNTTQARFHRCACFAIGMFPLSWKWEYKYELQRIGAAVDILGVYLGALNSELDCFRRYPMPVVARNV
jgi:hypothetical protein